MKRKSFSMVKKIAVLSMAAIMLIGCTGCGSKKSHVRTITNVSYDPTREFYEAYNPLFEKYYKEKTGKEVNIIQSHGGSGAQARSVVEGCNADVVTLALEHDITLIEQTGLIEKGWEQEFADDSSPYTSTIVFLVRKGNPKQIKDWDNLVNKKVEIITPDPKRKCPPTLCRSSASRCMRSMPTRPTLQRQEKSSVRRKIRSSLQAQVPCAAMPPPLSPSWLTVCTSRSSTL